MEQRNYETVFILTPVLSESQLKDAVGKYKKIIKNNGAEIIHEENWGMKKLAYEIQHKSSGFYQLFQYKAPSEIVNILNTEFRRDDKILRFLTFSLDKYALEFNERRSKGLLKSQKEAAENKKPDSPRQSTKQADKIPSKTQEEQAISQSKPPEPSKLEKKSTDLIQEEVKVTVEKPEKINSKDQTIKKEV